MVAVFLALLAAQVPPEDAVSLRELEPSRIRVLLCPRPYAQTVAIAAGFRVGSAFDGGATCGCAHLLEHMMLFRGTELSPYADIVARWRSLGSGANGWTYPDYTVFTTSVPPEGLYKALELLRETLLHPAFSESDLNKERRVVGAELLQSESDQFLQMFRLANRALYAEHNYALPGYGYQRVVEEISAATLLSRFDEEYSPGRMTIAVVGPFGPETLGRTIEETFGGYTPGRTAPPDLGQLPPPEGDVRLVETSPSPRAQLVFAFRGPGSASKDWLPFVVVARLLCGGEGARLTERLVFQDGIAKSVTLFEQPRVLEGLALFRIVLEPELVGRCEREVRRVLSRVGDRPFDPPLVERVVNRLRLEFAQRQESPLSMAAELVAWDMLGTWEFPRQVGTQLANVTSEQLRRIAEIYFTADRARIVCIVPEGYTPPAEAEPGAVTSVRRAVDSPFPMIAQSLPSSKVFSFALAVRGGLAVDPPGLEGLGGMVARTVIRGDEGEKGERFLDQLSRWGVRAEAGTGRDYTYLRFSAPSGAFEDALGQISRAILRPALREDELEHVRQEVLADVVNFPSIADAAERVLWQEAFAGLPYAVFPPGSVESVEALRSVLPLQARGYWETWWRPENFAVAVCGPREVDELVGLVERTFAPLKPPSSAPRPDVRFVLPRRRPQVHVVDQDLAQAYVLHGWFADESTVDTLVAFLLMREILAGAPGTRLWRLRQEEGLLYYINAKVVLTARVVTFQLAMILPLDKVRLATDLLMEEIGEIAAGPVGEEELELARRALIQEARRRTERGLSLAEEEAWFLLWGWKRQALLERQRNMTPEEFQLKIRRFFKKSGIWTVAVGPRERVEPQLFRPE